MQRTFLWFLLLLLLSGIALWFSVSAVSKVVAYSRLSAVASGRAIHWEVVRHSGTDFRLQAQFLFEVEGTEYVGTALLPRVTYRNAWAASDAIPKLEGRSWEVWYNPSYPEGAVLERVFPLKATLYALILVALAVYFLCLGWFVRSRLPGVE